MPKKIPVVEQAEAESAERALAWISDAGVGRGVLFVFLAGLPIVLSTSTLENFEYPKAMWLRLAMLCFLAPALVMALSHLRCLGRRDLFAELWLWCKSDLLSAGVLLLLLSASLSTLLSLNPRLSWWGEHTSYAGLITILAHVLIYFTARALASGVVTMERLLAGCLLAGLIAATVAFLQFAGIDPIGWTFTSNAGVFLRPFGTLGHPNHLGALLAMLFPIVMYFAWTEFSPDRRHSSLLRGGMMLLALIFLVGMLMAMSRAAWLGSAVGLAVWLGVRFWRRKETPVGQAASLSFGKRIAWGTLGAVALLLLLRWWNPHEIASGLEDRVVNLKSGQTRLIIWQQSLAVWLDHPIFGIGPDTFQLAFAPHRTPTFWDHEWDTTPTRPHNEILQVLVTQGLVGAAALLVFVVGLVQASLRALRHEDPQGRRFALALVSAAVVFLALSLFSFTAIGYGPIFMVLAAFLSRLGGVTTKTESGEWFRPAVGIAGVLMFMLLAWEMSRGFSAAPVGFWPVLAIVSMSLTAGVGWLLQWDRPTSRVVAVAERPARWMPFAAVGALGVGVFFLVILPWRANLACARGDSLLARDPHAALKHLEQAVSLDSAEDIYWTKLAQAHQTIALTTSDADERAAFLQRARTVWDRSVARSPLNGAHHDNRGVCLAHLCRHGLAAAGEVFASFDQAIKLDPTNPLFHADAADAALRLGRNDLALRYAEAGLKQNARYGPLFGQVGYLKLRADEDAEACEHLEKSLELLWEDNHRSWKDAAIANLIVAYHRTRNYRKLEPLAVEFLAQHPDATAIRALLAEARKQRRS